MTRCRNCGHLDTAHFDDGTCEGDDKNGCDCRSFVSEEGHLLYELDDLRK